MKQSLQIEMKRETFITQLVIVMFGSMLLALSAQFSIPLKPVPITLQSIVVVVLGAKLGKNAGTAAVLAYLTQGALGLPVFANGNLGLAHLISPTGGYLLAFVPAAYLSGIIVKSENMRKSVLGIFIILVGILITGTFWLSIFCGFKTAFYSGFILFLPGAVIKTLLAVMLLPVLE